MTNANILKSIYDLINTNSSSDSETNYQLSLQANIFGNSDTLIFNAPHNLDLNIKDNTIHYHTKNKNFYLNCATPVPIKKIGIIQFTCDSQFEGNKPAIWIFEYAGKSECSRQYYFINSGLFIFYHKFMESATSFRLALRFSGNGLAIFENLSIQKSGAEQYKIYIESKSRKLNISREIILKQLFDKGNKQDFPLLRECREAAARGWESFADWQKNLRIATIMDEFTWQSYSPEASMLQLSPTSWRNELEDFQPQLLFVESAWRGKDEAWYNNVHKIPDELLGILLWCHEHNVPTFFWNKEDPGHFKTFINIARLFNFIATFELNCIPRYKHICGNNRVFFLPMAVQPRRFNPLEKYERLDSYCFAGSCYARYPIRQQALESFLDSLPALHPVDIYDRQHGKCDPRYMFPEKYTNLIKGYLPYNEIDRAYKGYKYAINLTSWPQQQTQLARRVVELMACNTFIVSNYSKGLRNLFGDLAIDTNNGAEAVRRIKALEDVPYGFERLRLQALRKVMRSYTYQDMLASILCQMAEIDSPSPLPPVLIIAPVENHAQVENAISDFLRQEYPDKKLWLAPADNFKIDSRLPANVSVIAEAPLDALLFGMSAWIAVFHPDDWHGPHYLMDLALATRYAVFDAAGKGAFFRFANGRTEMVTDVPTYTFTNSLPARSSLARPKIASASHFRVCELATVSWHGVCLAIDPFNYCENGANQPDADLSILSDLHGVDEGNEIGSLQKYAREIAPANEASSLLKHLDSREIYNEFLRGTHKKASTISKTDNGDVLLSSRLQAKEYEYIYAKSFLKIKDLIKPGASGLEFFLDAGSGLNVRLGATILDARGNKLIGSVFPSMSNATMPIPEGGETLRLSLRVSGPGSAEIRNIYFEHREDEQQSIIIPSSSHLLITNIYPSYDNLYRNGFVHSRVRCYHQEGLRCGVFVFQNNTATTFEEFEDVDVTRGGAKALRDLLSQGVVKSVMVHFLDAGMWEVLREFADRIKINIWLHGSEVQPWTRRIYNMLTEEDFVRAKKESEARMAFWAGFFREIPEKTHLVFVSRYFANEIMEDNEVDLPANKYSIIHNPIDTNIFSYKQKSADQRYRVLAITSFASRKYGPDLISRCILNLSKRPDFHKFSFMIFGKGILLEENARPLRVFTNVRFSDSFLTQRQIAQIHAEYGVFLSPTRMDAQGVSKQEAMASGLVPVTNRVAAIPEFMDDDCAILAPAEDALGLADGIGRLADNADLFLKMSRAAAERAIAQTSIDMIINQEMALII